MFVGTLVEGVAPAPECPELIVSFIFLNWSFAKTLNLYLLKYYAISSSTRKIESSQTKSG